MQLSQLKVAVLATDGFEESELTEPVRALKDAGATVELVSLKKGRIQAYKHHDKTIVINVDKSIDDVKPSDYDAVVLPGGALNADTMRASEKVKLFLNTFDRTKKPIAAICHAAWELISAGVIKGRTLTSYHTIRDDVQNAGGKWVDREVVIDDNLVTSRQPDDLPSFNREMLGLFDKVTKRRAA